MSAPRVSAPNFASSIAPFHVLVFSIGGRRFAFPLARIEKVLPAVEVTPWPHVPRFLAGVIEVRGQVLPVVKADELLNVQSAWEEAEATGNRIYPAFNDHFVVVQHGEMRIVLWVERALEVALVGEQELRTKGISSTNDRWSPIRIASELTLLWHGEHLFDERQTQVLQELCATLGAKMAI